VARIYPQLTTAQLDELPSQAEATVYKCLRDSLDDSHLVIHGKSYVVQRRDGGHGDGEADFLVFSADYGLLALEVKGGGISYDPNTGWQSVDRWGRTHEIKDPFAQAKRQKYVIMEQLRANHAWTALRRRIALGHAVLLPDIDSVAHIHLPECPSDIIGGGAALRNISDWIGSVNHYLTTARTSFMPRTARTSFTLIDECAFSTD